MRLGLRKALLVLIAAATAAVPAFADPAAPVVPSFGPAIGNDRYEAQITSVDGIADVDDYVGSMVGGETLSATVVAVKKSTLKPKLDLIGPDGTPAAPAIRVTKAGTTVQLRNFKIPSTGRWTVRVSGANGSEGAYSIAFILKPAPTQALRGRQLGEDQPLFKVETFRGVDGATLDFKLTWTKTSNAVELRSMSDPSGADVLASDGKTAASKAVVDLKRRTISLSGLELHAGDGAYSVLVRTAQGASVYDATFAVTPNDRPKTRKPIVLGAAEPYLDPQANPLRGRPGFLLHLTGRNFSTKPPAQVFFGLVESPSATVAADGASVDATVPQGVPGTTVSVGVVNGDGQAAVRGGYFYYLQPVTVTDLVDDTGSPVRVASSLGGLRLHLKGTFFEQGQLVRFGDANAQIDSVVDSTEMIVVTPATHGGLVNVVVVDQFGGTATSSFQFQFKAPPTFAKFPYQPSVAAVNRSALVTITGSDFEAEDQLTFDGTPIASTYLGFMQRTFTLPALPAGAYSVTLTDSIGTVVQGPDFTVKPPPTVTAVTIVAGPHIGATGVPVSGGATIQVDGTNFHETDAVTLGSGAVTSFLSHSATQFTFLSPPGSPGSATLSVIDGANQGTTLANALRFVGYVDATGARSPGASTVDNLLADRGAVGDLDGDGKADDVVIVSAYYAPGTRSELTRLFFGNSQGALVDVTSTKFPAAGSDSNGSDNWNASAVAIGDVDRTHGADIVIAGAAPYSASGAATKSIRIFKNDVSGAFTQDEADAPPSPYAAAVSAVTPTGASYVVYGTVFENGVPNAMALGDLDGDGWPDLVVARDHYDYRYVGIDPTFVNFSQSPPTVATANVSYLSYFQYTAATKIYKNDIVHGNGFVNVTASAMPSVGTSLTAPTPCFQARDIALGDVDGDGFLDIVETWDDPTTVSAYGTYNGSNVDTPRTATRVLINDRHGNFTDATSSWMPSAPAPEFWQGNRLALVDTNGDGKIDLLVILHAQGTDAYNTSPPSFSSTALRVLRNGGPGVGFVDITSTAIPALPGNGDNFRGTALAVRDVDGDGRPDIVIGTTEALSDSAGNPLRSTRLFRGGPNNTFTRDEAFLAAASSDSGECGDLLLGDLSTSSSSPDPSLILLSTVVPTNSHNGEALRVFDWKR